jgi:hypothetical protein
VCAKHPGSHVIAHGTDRTRKGLVRRFVCTPATGKRHTFSVLVEADPSQLREARWSPPPGCPEHPGGKVIRSGVYGRATAKPRQLYRCFPDPSDRSTFHAFTPALPRDHVHDGEEHCGHCDELRGIHRGETAVARRHSWSSRTVAEGLSRLSAGETYADVSRWARRVSGSTRTRRRDDDGTSGSEQPNGEATDDDVDPFFAPDEEAEDTGPTGAAAKKKPTVTTVEARNWWHIAADWVEAFGPVVFGPVETRLRELALSEWERLDELAAQGQRLERPQVVLVDDVPVYGRELDRTAKGKSRRDAGFFVLVAAEVLWDSRGPVTKLRLARAMPKSNTAAWRLVFDELGYAPDFVVADAGTGIGAAVAAHFDPARTCFVPSLWHLTNRIERALADTRGAFTTTSRGTDLITPIAKHLRLLNRHSGVLNDTAAWAQWWDELEGLLVAHKMPLDKVRTQRRNSEPRMAAALARLATQPDVPVSTGGLETIIAKRIHPMLAGRRQAFANLERTNLLFDLAVARDHGAFDDINTVIAALRADTEPNGGWTVPLRSVADPRPRGGSYSSLRDATLLADLAADRGLK